MAQEATARRSAGRRRIHTVGVLASVTALLAGCSTGQAAAPATVTIVAETTPPAEPANAVQPSEDPSTASHPVATEAEAPRSSANPVDATFPVRTEDGYTADVHLVVTEPQVSLDPTNAPPGQTDLTLRLEANLTIKNTTAGRNLPIPVLAFERKTLGVIWNKTVPFCRDYQVAEFIKKGKCAFEIGAFDFASQPGLTAVEAGGSASTALRALPVNYTMPTGATYTWRIPEGDGPAAQKALTSGAVYALSLGGTGFEARSIQTAGRIGAAFPPSCMRAYVWSSNGEPPCG